MKPYFLVPLACLALIGGCASAERQAEMEANQKQWRETEHRLRTLEQGVTTLDTQVAQLNNRVYEVRNSKGRKTGLTVAPMLPPSADAQPAAVASAPAGKNAAVGEGSTPKGRVVTPKPVGKQGAARKEQRRGDVSKATSASAKPVSRSASSMPRETSSRAAEEPLLPELPPEGPPLVADAASPAQPAALPRVRDDSAQVPAVSSESSGLALPPESATSPAVASEGPVSSASSPSRKSGKGEDAAYKEAVRPAMAGRSAESISRFTSFLQEYPGGRYAANAEYWIGEGYFSQGKYQEALSHFKKVNASWPRHHKNADALLKTGMTLSRLGDKAGAAEAYNRLLTQFPKSEAARRLRAQRHAR